MKNYWTTLSLVERIRFVRYVMPLVLIPIVVVYQLKIAFQLEARYGHPIHYAAEITFYSFVGPVVTWLTLIWVERRLKEKEALEFEVRARTEQLAALTSASPDAILRLDRESRITSWNAGAARLFGYTAEDMLHQPIEALLPEAENPHGLEFSTDENVQSVEMTAIAMNGLPVRVDLTQAILQREGVRLLILRDITLRSERAAILEEERARIARDLHDGLAQTLYFVALKADMVQAQLAQGPEGVQRHLQEISKQTRGAIQEVRRAILGLKPLDWEQGDFVDALQAFANRFAQDAQLKLDFQSNIRPADIPPRLQPHVFRIIQESMNNIAKHAGASNVSVEIHRATGPDQLRLRITDNGRGFDPEARQTGMGLAQLKKRAKNAQGSFLIDSRPGAGTRIEALMPLLKAGK